MSTGQPYSFGRFTLDPATNILCEDGAPVALGATDFRLLHVLVERGGVVVSKPDLMELVWGNSAVSDSALYFHINALRKVLGDECIVNKQGYGYRFTTPITPPGKSGLSPRSSHFPHSFSGETSREPARLIGRDAQLRTVSNLLLQGRLVTLTGPGGVGKTRLALRAAADMAEHFCDGFWVVELAALNNADMLASAVAAVLGVQLRPKVAPHEALSRHVKGKSLLIVLDNCEHVIFEAAGLVEGLLNGAPGVKVLATSREMLSCSGEQVVEVPPLALPDQDDNTPDQIRATPSIELFVERAIAADTAFRVADEDLSCVVKICRRVDGLPLAIEMAAAWAGPLGLQTLEAKLDGSLKAWLRARSTAPVRHSTLRATLEWSHSLLTPAEQTVFRRLAVFPDTFSMEGAEAIAADDAVSADQVFEHVANLRRKSMISVVPEAQTQRFRLLETTRAFMLEQLASSGEHRVSSEQHASYVLKCLEKAMSELETTSDAVWFERYANPILSDLRSASDWAMRETSDCAVALAGISWPLWRELSLRTEGGYRLRAAADRLRPETPAVLEARLRRGIGEMLLNTTETKFAHSELVRAAFLYRRSGTDPGELGSAIGSLAFALFTLGRLEEAESTVREAIALLEPARWLRTLATAYSTLLCIEATLGQRDQARVAGEKALHLCRMSGNRRTALLVSANLIQMDLEGGDLNGAISAGRDLISRLRADRHSDLPGFVLGLLTAGLIARGDLNDAFSTAQQAAPLLRDDGELFWLFDHLAELAALRGRAKDACLIIGYSDALYLRSSRTRERMACQAVERLHVSLNKALPADEIAALGQLGTRLSEEQALALALST